MAVATIQGVSSNSGRSFNDWTFGGRQNYELQARSLAQQDRQWREKLEFYKDLLGKRNIQTDQLGGIVNNYNEAFAQAKAANEAKYNQALSLPDQYSGQRAADIRSQYANQRSAALQNLARTGLGNTTVGSTLTQGLAREQTSALNRLSDQVLQQKLGVMQNFEYKYPETAIPTALITALTQQPNWPSL